MLKKNEIINQVLTRKKVNVFQDKTAAMVLFASEERGAWLITMAKIEK
jgi:hypothetical protein